MRGGAVEKCMFEGAGDRGSEARPPEPMPSPAGSCPWPKRWTAITLAGMRMNGRMLDGRQGAPLRLFVPGWYGVASVKCFRVLDRARSTVHGY